MSIRRRKEHLKESIFILRLMTTILLEIVVRHGLIAVVVVMWAQTVVLMLAAVTFAAVANICPCLLKDMLLRIFM